MKNIVIATIVALPLIAGNVSASAGDGKLSAGVMKSLVSENNRIAKRLPELLLPKSTVSEEAARINEILDTIVMLQVLEQVAPEKAKARLKERTEQVDQASVEAQNHYKELGGSQHDLDTIIKEGFERNNDLMAGLGQ